MRRDHRAQLAVEGGGFDALRARRERFGVGLATDIRERAGRESAAAVEVLAGDRRTSADSPLGFECETVRDWTAFVESDGHETGVDNPSELPTDSTAALRRRGSVVLDRTVGDGGEPRPSASRSNPLTSQ